MSDISDGMPVRFTALVDFFSEETASQYVAGLGYTARPEDTVLRGLLPRWLDDGKIKLGGTGATLTGTGG